MLAICCKKIAALFFEEGLSMSIFAGAIDYFVKGGPCMWPLLMCSFAAIAIGVERYLFYKKAISGEKFASSFCRMMNDLIWLAPVCWQSRARARLLPWLRRFWILRVTSASVWKL